jgi:hypothetical protein
MNDDQLRALVRAAIAQHVGSTEPPRHSPPPMTALRLHASHGMFTTLTDGAADDSPCVIEPAVMCNHCGYCKSYGH